MIRFLNYITLLFFVLTISSCSNNKRYDLIKEIKPGDSIENVFKIFGKPDQVFIFSKKIYPNLKKTEEDSVYVRYYKSTNFLNNDGVKIYSDSKIVLHVSLND